MTEFLTALKADLLDRRLMPLVALVAIALIGAIAYAVLGGGGSTASTPRTVATPGASTGSSGLTISQSTTEKAVAETTNGAAEQRKGVARNPFKPLPEAAKQVASTSTATATGGSTTTSAGSGSSNAGTKSGSGSSTGSGGSGTTTTPSKPSTPAKPQTVYYVAVLFGTIPAGTAANTALLTPFVNIKLLTPLPDSKQPRIVYRGVTAKGKSATFTLVGKAILHGAAACLPRASQCQALDLAPGHYEQLKYMTPSGETVVYELRVVSITPVQASSASVKSLLRGESKAGRELLRHSRLTTIPCLHQSSQAGVLMFAGCGASVARAHASVHHGHRA